MMNKWPWHIYAISLKRSQALNWPSCFDDKLSGADLEATLAVTPTNGDNSHQGFAAVREITRLQIRELT